MCPIALCGCFTEKFVANDYFGGLLSCAKKKRKVDDGLMLKAPNGPGHKDGLDGGPTFSKKLARLNAQCGWINSVANLLAILANSHENFLPILSC